MDQARPPLPSRNGRSFYSRNAPSIPSRNAPSLPSRNAPSLPSRNAPPLPPKDYRRGAAPSYAPPVPPRNSYQEGYHNQQTSNGPPPLLPRGSAIRPHHGSVPPRQRALSVGPGGGSRSRNGGLRRKRPEPLENLDLSRREQTLPMTKRRVGDIYKMNQMMREDRDNYGRLVDGSLNTPPPVWPVDTYPETNYTLRKDFQVDDWLAHNLTVPYDECDDQQTEYAYHLGHNNQDTMQFAMSPYSDEGPVGVVARNAYEVANNTPNSADRLKFNFRSVPRPPGELYQPEGLTYDDINDNFERSAIDDRNFDYYDL